MLVLAKKVLAIILSVISVSLLAVIIVSAATGWRIGKTETAASRPANVNGNIIPTFAAKNDGGSSVATEASVTEKATQAPKSKLPYEDSLGAPKDSDFAWMYGSGNTLPDGAKLLGRDDIIGKWKCEFSFDGMWEMNYLTIDEDGNVTVRPYKINRGSGWEDESDAPAYTLKGRFDVNAVYAEGESGTMLLSMFYQQGSVQYGKGTFDTLSGDVIPVGLVRP